MAIFPGGVSSDGDLSVAVNNLQTSLDGNHTIGVTTITVLSTTGFPSAGYVTIDNEIVRYTGKTGATFTGATRGSDGSTAVAHLSGESVKLLVIAAHHNSLKDEVKAIEQALADRLGNGTSFFTTEQWVDVRKYASINAAVTAIGSTQTTLVVNTAQTLTANLTVPSTLSLKILDGGSIVKASTYTLTINGPFSAPMVQVFSGFSAGNVTFGPESLLEVYPEWWTTNAVPGTTDMTSAINQAIMAFTDVKLSPTTYFVPSGGINILGTTAGTGSRFTGSGYNTIIQGNTGGANGLIKINAQAGVPGYRMYTKIGQFLVKNTGTSTVGILLSEAANVVLENITIRGFTTGLNMVGALICSFNNMTFESNVTGVKMATGSIIPSPTNLVQFRDCQMVSNSKYAVKCDEGSSVLFTGCEIESNGTAAQVENVCEFGSMSINGVNPGVTFDNCWFEDNHGGADVYYRGTNQTGGINILNTAFYSTNVNYNLDINTATAFIAGCGTNATVITANALIGSDTAGVWLGAVAITITNNSLLFIVHNASSGALNFPSNIVPQFDRQLKITPTTNQLVLGTTRTATITAPTPAGSSRVYTIPDPGADASVVMTESAQTINGAKTFSSAVPITPTTNQLVLGATRTVTINAPTPATSSRTWTLPDLTTSPTVAALEGTQTFSGSKDFSAALGLSSGQINFPATQVPSAGANVLDDYEEGQVTATMTCGTSGTITLDSTFNKMLYTKVGRAVHVTAYLLVSSVSSPVGSLTINGLPFTSTDYAGVAVWCDGLQNTATTTVKGFVNKAATTIILQKFAAGAESALAGDIKANTEIMLSVTYFV